MEVSTDWYVTIEHWRSSSIRVIFIDYQTSKLQCNYQSYIQMDSIGDAQGFSGKAPITLSRGFSVETLTGVIPSQKTKLNRSISAMEDRIPRWLQHCHKTCYEKGDCHGRWACMFWEIISLWGCNLQMGGLIYDNVLWILSSQNTSIYSIDTALQSLHFTTYNIPYLLLKSLLKCNLSSSLRL